jgi:hypothetical protein
MIRRWLFWIPILLSFSHYTRAEEPGLKTGMSELHSILLNLNTDLARSLPEPGSPEHQRIEVRMERLSRLAHRVTQKKQNEGTGQLYPILGEALPEQSDQMTSAWRIGQTIYSRALFRTLSSTCIECHTAASPRSPILHRIEDKDLSLWSPIDRVRYLRSVGFTEQAFEELKQLIERPVQGRDSADIMEDALYELLSLEIRTRNRPDRLMGLLKTFSERESIPKYLRSDLRGWIRDLQVWTREPSIKGTVPAATHLNRARQHIRKARTLQESHTDRSSQVWYWRAVSELYASLRGGLRTDQRGDALFWLGSAFEVLTPRNQETLHERFYESCIREVPHTPRSDLCYRKLERSVVAGYTGSSGTRIPEEVRKRLLELWGLAFLSKGLDLR